MWLVEQYAKRSLLILKIFTIFQLCHAHMRKDTWLSSLFRTASDEKLGGAWEQDYVPIAYKYHHSTMLPSAFIRVRSASHNANSNKRIMSFRSLDKFSLRFMQHNMASKFACDRHAHNIITRFVWTQVAITVVN